MAQRMCTVPESLQPVGMIMKVTLLGCLFSVIAWLAFLGATVDLWNFLGLPMKYFNWLWHQFGIPISFALGFGLSIFMEVAKNSKRQREEDEEFQKWKEGMRG